MTQNSGVTLNFEYLFSAANVVTDLANWSCALEFFNVNCCASCSILNVGLRNFFENFCKLYE